MSKGDKYIKLKNFLINSNQPTVKLSFRDIEKIIDSELPPSAYKHSAWWANDTKCHVQSISWLEAGYQTDCVSETYREKQIVFIKVNSF